MHSANMNVMIKAARKAGRSLVKDFREVENLQVSVKGAGDFVTRADGKPVEGFSLAECDEVFGDSLDRVVTHLLPFVGVILVCLLVITYVPSISLTLRDLVYAK